MQRHVSPPLIILTPLHWSNSLKIFTSASSSLRTQESTLHFRHFIHRYNYYYEVKFNVAIVIPIPQNTLSMKYVVPYHPRSFRWNRGLRHKKKFKVKPRVSLFQCSSFNWKMIGATTRVKFFHAINIQKLLVTKKVRFLFNIVHYFHDHSMNFQWANQHSL